MNGTVIDVILQVIQNLTLVWIMTQLLPDASFAKQFGLGVVLSFVLFLSDTRRRLEMA